MNTLSWPSRMGLQNTPAASLQRGKIPPKSVQIMTLNNLMARSSNAGALGNTE